MSFVYEVNASFAQSTGKLGERATLTVEYSGVSRESAINRSMVRIANYGIFDVMKRGDEGTFTWSYLIPMEAPLGTYDIEVYATDTEGSKGKIERLAFQVVA
jgi:hypothetical protein